MNVRVAWYEQQPWTHFIFFVLHASYTVRRCVIVALLAYNIKVYSASNSPESTVRPTVD